MMPEFRYRAVTTGNEVRTGTVTGHDSEQAWDILASRGMTPTRIWLPSPGERLWRLLQTDITPRRPIADVELSAFSRNLATMLGAGIPLLDALSVVGAKVRDKRLADLARHLQSCVASGMSLKEALRLRGDETGPRFVAAVGAGEAGGKLDIVLAKLGSELAERAETSRAMLQACIYPAVLAIASLASLAVLFFVVVPSLAGLIDTDELARLPMATRLLIAVSSLLTQYGSMLGTGIAAIVVTLGLSFALPTVRRRWHRLTFAIGPIRDRHLGRYLADLGLMLSASVPLDVALRLASEATASTALQARVDRLVGAVSTGSSLAGALSRAGIADAEVVTLVGIGERSGRLAERVTDAAQILTRRATDRIKVFGALLGPVLTLVFGTASGLTAAALLTTILSLNSLAGQ